MGEANAYHFFIKDAGEFPALSEDDKSILDIVIDKLGKKNMMWILEINLTYLSI